MISFSAPGKIHLLGEHTVVYGKPAILTAINLRVYVTISENVIPTQVGIQLNHSAKWIPAFAGMTEKIQKAIEPIIKKKLKLQTIPPYQVQIDSQTPIGSGLGSSAAVSAAYIAALLSFLKIKWDLKLVNELAFEAEKIFHGNPSGADNTTVVYGGFIWYQKGTPFTPLPFKIHKNIKSFYLIHSGKPLESTREMVERVSSRFKIQDLRFKKILEDQEKLVKELAQALKYGNEGKLIEIIRDGERNLEKIGVVGKKAQKIIREVEKAGGAAKISGAGGFKDGSGIILCYGIHPDGIKITIGESGLRQE